MSFNENDRQAIQNLSYLFSTPQSTQSSQPRTTSLSAFTSTRPLNTQQTSSPSSSSLSSTSSSIGSSSGGGRSGGGGGGGGGGVSASPPVSSHYSSHAPVSMAAAQNANPHRQAFLQEHRQGFNINNNVQGRKMKAASSSVVAELSEDAPDVLAYAPPPSSSSSSSPMPLAFASSSSSSSSSLSSSSISSSPRSNLVQARRSSVGKKGKSSDRGGCRGAPPRMASCCYASAPMASFCCASAPMASYCSASAPRHSSSFFDDDDEDEDSGWGGGPHINFQQGTHLPSVPNFGKIIDKDKSILSAPPEKTFAEPFETRLMKFRFRTLPEYVRQVLHLPPSPGTIAATGGGKPAVPVVSSLSASSSRAQSRSPPPPGSAAAALRPLAITVKKGYMFVQSSFDKINNLKVNDLLRETEISYEGEPSKPEGDSNTSGVRREWFSSIIPCITNPDYGLFATDVANENRISITHLARVAQDYPNQFFKFVGIVMAKAVLENLTVPTTFTRFLFKTLQGEEGHVSDIVSVDPELAAQLAQMEKEEDISAHNIPFSLNIDTFGDVQEVELIADGSTTLVTNENRQQFIILSAKHRIYGGTSQYLDALVNGFNSLVPAHLIKDFTPEELELIICGQPAINVEEWKKNSAYTNGFTADSPTVVWFWEVLTEMKDLGRQLVLYFATGSRTPPAHGFAFLPGKCASEIKRFELSQKTASITNTNVASVVVVDLPVACTSLNRITLPAYATKTALVENLLVALAKINDRFTTGLVEK